jgi:predicted nucleotidyltransferase
MGYREEYLALIERLYKLTLDFYGERLVTFAIFGSVAKDTFRPDSDIDILIISEDLPRGRTKRILEFEHNIGQKISQDLKDLAKKGIYPYLSPVFKTKEEVKHEAQFFLI